MRLPATLPTCHVRVYRAHLSRPRLPLPIGGVRVCNGRPPGMCTRKTVELDELLGAMDRTAANLAKLDAIWQRAQPFIPTAPSLGSYPEYDDLRRTWHDLLPGLPEIDGWTVREELPDINELGIAYLEYHEINQPVNELLEAGAAPGRALDEYRFRLNRARRRAARSP